MDTVHAYVLSICFWRASLKKQNRKIHWHFESWIHRRCCLQCAENIRPQQPEQAWCQAISLGEKEEVWSRPFRIISNSAAAVWVWLCSSCCGRPALTLEPLGNVRAVFSTKDSSLGHPRAKAKMVWRWKEGGASEDGIWENHLGRRRQNFGPASGAHQDPWLLLLRKQRLGRSWVTCPKETSQN